MCVCARIYSAQPELRENILYRNCDADLFVAKLKIINPSFKYSSKQNITSSFHIYCINYKEVSNFFLI